MSIERSDPTPEEMGVEQGRQADAPPSVEEAALSSRDSRAPESTPEVDARPIELTQEERDLLLTGADNPAVQQLIAEKGIVPDSGDCNVIVEGRVFRISTDSSHDFGLRLVDPPTANMN